MTRGEKRILANIGGHIDAATRTLEGIAELRTIPTCAGWTAEQTAAMDLVSSMLRDWLGTLNESYNNRVAHFEVLATRRRASAIAKNDGTKLAPGRQDGPKLPV